MKLKIRGGVDVITLIDENDNTVCTFAVCDEDARQTAQKMCRAFNNHDELISALKTWGDIGSTENLPRYIRDEAARSRDFLALMQQS